MLLGSGHLLPCPVFVDICPVLPSKLPQLPSYQASPSLPCLSVFFGSELELAREGLGQSCLPLRCPPRCPLKLLRAGVGVGVAWGRGLVHRHPTLPRQHPLSCNSWVGEKWLGLPHLGLALVEISLDKGLALTSSASVALWFLSLGQGFKALGSECLPPLVLPRCKMGYSHETLTNHWVTSFQSVSTEENGNIDLCWHIEELASGSRGGAWQELHCAETQGQMTGTKVQNSDQA